LDLKNVNPFISDRAP